MLDGKKPTSYPLEMSIAKKVFAEYEGHEDFLSKVKPPFKMEGSIKYLISPDGKKYLKKKYQEFYFEVPDREKAVDLGVKFGDDIVEKKPRTIREFLE